MNKKVIYTIIFMLLFSPIAGADRFVPEFDKMKTIKCQVNETIFNQDGTQVTKNEYFRVFNLDDENKEIYIQKAPVDGISYYDFDRVDFYLQQMTDDFIMQTSVTIDRENGNYTSVSSITYDNTVFGTRQAKAYGICSEIN